MPIVDTELAKAVHIASCCCDTCEQLSLDNKARLAVSVNFDEVRRNAREQGISLTEIAIIYENLTESEIHLLKERNLYVSQTTTKVIGRFSEDGAEMFSERAVGVHSLAS